MNRTIAFVVSIFTMHATAHAGIIYAFDQAAYTVNAGETVDVSVFLQQINGETRLTDFGIISASVNVFFNDPVVPSDPAEVLTIGDISPSSAFNDPFLTATFLDPGISAGLVGAADVTVTPDPIKGSSILLGTFRFTAGLVAGETTKLRATDLDLLWPDTVADNGDLLDSIIQDGFATITVNGPTAVPEPASGAVLGSLMLAGWWACRNASRREKVE